MGQAIGEIDLWSHGVNATAVGAEEVEEAVGADGGLNETASLAETKTTGALAAAAAAAAAFAPGAGGQTMKVFGGLAGEVPF